MDAQFAQSLPSNFIRISIGNVFTSESQSEGKFTVFVISVQAAFARWEICRRYRQFDALHSELMSRMPHLRLPSLPAKRLALFGGAFDPAFVEDRRAALEQYLRQLVFIPEVWMSTKYIEFMDHSQSFLGIHLKMTKFSNRITALEATVETLTSQLASSKRVTESAMNIIEQLQVRVETLEDRLATGNHGGMRLSASGNNLLYSDNARSTSGEETSVSTIADNFRRLSSEFADRTSLSWQGAPDFGLYPLDSAFRGSGVGSSTLSPSTSTSIFGAITNQGISIDVGMDFSKDSVFLGEEPDSKGTEIGSRMSFGSPNNPEQPDTESSLLLPPPGYFVKQMLHIGPINNYQYSSASNPASPTEDKTVVATEELDANRNSIVDTVFDSDVTTNGTNSGFDWGSISRSLGLPQSSQCPLMSSVNESCGTAEGSVWDHLVNEIVLMVQPMDAQLKYRRRVASFLSRQVKKTLGVHLFEIDVQGMRCFLPDDPLRLSIFVGRADKEATWYVKLNERLCRLSGGIFEDSDFQPSAEELWFETVHDLSDANLYGQQYQLNLSTVQRHALTNVSFLTNLDHSHKIQCLVDNILGVEIVANARSELCLLMFFEEFNKLVGKNSLFKRAVLLIRAWWVYEADLATTGIPDPAICILICAIFNRHHIHLFHPLQVLYAFLIEYSNLELSSHVLTVHGPVPYEVFADSDANALSLLSVPPPSCQSLMTPEFLSRYRGYAQAKDLSGVGGTADSDESAVDNSSSASTPGTSSPPSANPRQCFSQRPIMIAHPFLITKTNMIPEVGNASSSTSIKRTARLVQVLRKGAQDIRQMLLDEIEYNAAHGISNDSNRKSSDTVKSHESDLNVPGNRFAYHAAVDGFFKVVMSRFGRGWRPDAPADQVGEDLVVNQSSGMTPSISIDEELSSNRRRLSSGNVHDNYQQPPTLSVDSVGVFETASAPGGRLSRGSSVLATLSQGETILLQDDSSRDFSVLSFERLQDRIRYANLLLEAQISDSALRILSMEILAEKGSLPVGEIGKMLQEATAMNSMSVALKERFGGLKKFLERYPDDFVMSNDHPFNPHVYLRRPISNEDATTTGGPSTGSGQRSDGASASKSGSGASSSTSAKSKKRQQQQQQQPLQRGPVNGNSTLNANVSGANYTTGQFIPGYGLTQGSIGNSNAATGINARRKATPPVTQGHGDSNTDAYYHSGVSGPGGVGVQGKSGHFGYANSGYVAHQTQGQQQMRSYSADGNNRVPAYHTQSRSASSGVYSASASAAMSSIAGSGPQHGSGSGSTKSKSGNAYSHLPDPRAPAFVPSGFGF